MVNRCSWHSTVPSTSPSMIKSSRAKIWPLMVTFLPNAAGPPLRVEIGSGSKTLEGDDMVFVSLLGVSVDGAAEAGDAPAGLSGRCGSSSCVRLLHMGRRLLDLAHSIVLPETLPPMKECGSMSLRKYSQRL